MSTPTRNAALIEELVADLLPQKASPKEFKKWKDFASKTTRSSQYTRVNQFAIHATLEGLVEKFHVLNRQDLSDALANNLNKFKSLSDKLAPEILFLLLQLSDQPAKKTPDYSPSERPVELAPPTLTWEEILKDDPYSDEELWESGIDSESVLSSQEEDLSVPELSPSLPAQPNTAYDEPPSPSQQIFLRPDTDALKSLETLQYWNTQPLSEETSQLPLSELSLVREALLMIRGLGTLLFAAETQPVASVVFRSHVHGLGTEMSETTAPVFLSLMQSFANLGSDILLVRVFSRKPVADALMQAFQSSIQNCLSAFDKEVGDFERSFVSGSDHVIVSLIRTLEHLRTLSKPILAVRELIQNIESTRRFSHLELAYDRVCAYQASGDMQNFNCLGSIFFDSLQSFLKPIRKWMTEGVLSHGQSSFIGETDKALDKASIWHDQFHLRQTKSGELLAPKFVHASLKQILNAGKSIVFLHKLGVPTRFAETEYHPLTFQSVYDEGALVPFPVLFDNAFADWIGAMYSPASSILRDKLFQTYHLEQCVNALEEIYLCKDGTKMQALADPIFEGIDSRSSAWNDRYIVAERIRTLFETSQNINIDQLTVRTTPSKANAKSIKGSSNIVLEYSLPWPILNVIGLSSISTYQKTFRLLLQLYRAKYLLRQALFFRDEASRNPLAISIRHQLQWLVDIVHTHLIVTVIQPASEQLRERISAARDLDELRAAHDAFISSLQAQCLLSKNLSLIYGTLVALLELVAHFHAVRNSQNGRRSKTASAMNLAKRKAKRRQSRTAVLEESSDDDSADEKEEEYDADTEPLQVKSETAEDQMKKIRDDFNRQLAFLMTGLRGIARAGKEGSWEVLAQMLDCKAGR